MAAATGLHTDGFEAHEQRSGCEYLLTVCVSMHLRAHRHIAASENNPLVRNLST